MCSWAQRHMRLHTHNNNNNTVSYSDINMYCESFLLYCNTEQINTLINRKLIVF